MRSDTAALRQALADQVARSAEHLDPAWRRALEAIPRHIFLGGALYQPAGTRWQPVHRQEVGEDAWLRMAYSDTTWVTQVEGIDAADAPGPRAGNPTSSSTLPSLVVRTLQTAGIRDGDRVLEIGTGTGYSTAVLCHRLGEDNVTSIESDPVLARRAADHLKTAGYAPTLVTGDGLEGHPDDAGYDAIVATCAVRHIPPAWLWQLRDGGTITTTLSGWMLASGLIRLALDDDGTATGRFTGETVSYMLARPHERPPRPAFRRHPGRVRATHTDPALLQDWTGAFVAQLAAPSAELMTTDDTVILTDTATGSQAWTEPATDGWTIHQHGPLRLWDQTEHALTTWQSAGAPDQTHFGMTVTDHEQAVWIGTPDGPRWQLPM